MTYETHGHYPDQISVYRRRDAIRIDSLHHSITLTEPDQAEFVIARLQEWLNSTRLRRDGPDTGADDDRSPG